MTQVTEVETVELTIVSCETCDQLFVCSPRRDSCPTCGGPAGLRFFEFLGDASGLHLQDGTLGALAAAPVAAPAEASLVAPAPEAPAAEEAATEELEPNSFKDLGAECGAFVGSSEVVSEEELRGRFSDLGAEPEDAVTAVGRLVAVRDLLRDLEAPEAGAGELPAVPEPTQAEGDQDSEPSEGV